MAQKSITAFFKASSSINTKRPANAQISSESKSGSKKQKTIIFDGPEKENDELHDNQTFPNEELQADILLQCSATPALHSSIGQSWFEALRPEFSKPYFKTLSDYVTEQRSSQKVFPPEKDVFAWTHHFPVDAVKVVILGQDPYHGPHQAHGLCFSVQAGVPPPPSLKNIYKELENDIEGFKAPGHGYLMGWAEQGVLLLNAVLTVQAHKANSHKGRGWEQLTTAVIKAVAERNKGVVFLLWGKDAEKKTANIDTAQHHLLSSTHPSPLSCHRGFLGCKHFSRCNELLLQQDKPAIDWRQLPL